LGVSPRKLIIDIVQTILKKKPEQSVCWGEPANEKEQNRIAPQRSRTAFGPGGRKTVDG